MNRIYFLSFFLILLNFCQAQTNTINYGDTIFMDSIQGDLATYFKIKTNLPPTYFYIKYKNIDQIWLEGLYKNGEKEGIHKIYHQSGGLKSTETFVSGKKNGLAIHYYENGAVLLKTYYKNGLQDGISYGYFQDSTQRVIYNHYEGQCIDTTKYFYPSGGIKVIEVYSDSHFRKEEIKYYANGQMSNYMFFEKRPEMPNFPKIIKWLIFNELGIEIERIEND